MITAAMLQLIHDTGEGVLVLMDGVEDTEFKRSRLTRSEVCRMLRQMVQTLEALPDEARAAMPEIDWAGWRATGLALSGAVQAEGDDAAWFAVRSLVPATLSWLRVYRQDAPQLFRFRP